ncbi:unnamed protein product [[Candida] boidinii]|uniref:Unnamed protein product n=1 Tax=Candida boidinii TaxID=5477 RepID=A0ACB5TJN3_CANBO|nr:unnamed protein product [[Candida] boidinii]GMF07429.1 unnamed protein product [[Candida] boidinii]
MSNLIKRLTIQDNSKSKNDINDTKDKKDIKENNDVKDTKDSKDNKENKTNINHDGASLSEQIIEAARRNNTDLLEEIFEELNNDNTKISDLINNSRDPVGNTPIHLTCKYGCYDVLDKILDIEGVEIDPINPKNGDTPLHYAVAYSFQEPDYALFMVENLLEVGADPKIKNKDNLKPVELASSSNEPLINALQAAEYSNDFSNGLEEEDVDDDDDDDDGESDDGESDDGESEDKK